MELNEKQLQIVQVAEKLFAEHGFAGTSVRQIAKEANINIAMISYYFGSKEKLLEHMVVYRMSDFKGELDTIINQDSSFKSRFNQIIELFVQRIHKNNRIYKIVHTELSNSTRCLTFEHYLVQKKNNYDALTEFINKGQEQYEFKNNIEIPLIIPTILGTYFDFHHNLVFFKETYNLDTPEAIEHYINHTIVKHLQNMLCAMVCIEVS